MNDTSTAFTIRFENTIDDFQSIGDELFDRLTDEHPIARVFSIQTFVAGLIITPCLWFITPDVALTLVPPFTSFCMAFLIPLINRRNFRRTLRRRFKNLRINGEVDQQSLTLMDDRWILITTKMEKRSNKAAVTAIYDLSEGFFIHLGENVECFIPARFLSPDHRQYLLGWFTAPTRGAPNQ